MEVTAAPAEVKKPPPHPLPWLNMLVTEPYYLLHFLTFFSYVVARSAATEILASPELHPRLLRREIQAVLAFLVLAVVKGFLFAVALLIDCHLAFCYLVGFLGKARV